MSNTTPWDDLQEGKTHWNEPPPGIQTPWNEVAPGEKVSHSALDDLDADDHPQYLTQPRADTLYAPIGGGGGGVTDHGELTGLADDDHPQYHTDGRGDVRYSALGHNHSGDYSPVGHNHSGVYAPVLGTDDNYVTDAEKVKLTNLSGVNTGDQVLPTWSTISGKPAVVAEGSSQATARASIDAAQSLGSDDNYVTDAEKVKLTNLSGTNTGDQVLPTWTTISGKPAVVAAGTTQANARASITAAVSPTGTPDGTKFYRDDGTWAVPAGGGGGVTDHGALTGLADDDHPHYLNNVRGDARYTPIATGITGDGTITKVVAMTQAAYDALGTKVPTTLYVVT